MINSKAVVVVDAQSIDYRNVVEVEDFRAENL
jgi:hypothetical protein